MTTTTNTPSINILEPIAPIEQRDGYTLQQFAPITLGKTTYEVERQVSTWVDSMDGKTKSSETIWLTGPRGASYFLRASIQSMTGTDSGMRQVVSWKSGQPLRVQGNEVRVTLLGDIIEVVK